MSDREFVYTSDFLKCLVNAKPSWYWNELFRFPDSPELVDKSFQIEIVLDKFLALATREGAVGTYQDLVLR
jgi:hypothetical protein